MMEELRALHTKCLHTEKKKDPHHPPCKHFKHFPYQRRSRYQFEKENFRRGEKKSFLLVENATKVPSGTHMMNMYSCVLNAKHFLSILSVQRGF